MADFKQLCGWVPNPAGVDAYLNDPKNKHPIFAAAGRDVKQAYEKKDTFLYEPLVQCKPGYQRTAQTIGDCVAHGLELACTVLTAKNLLKLGRGKDFIEAAAEPIYGGARVEENSGRLGGYQDGAYGAAAARFVRNYGVLYRRDYSQQTGNPEHDLRVYNGKKAKDWGNFGCGGQNDKGKLDKIAHDFPILSTTQVGGFEDVAAAIAGSKCPVTIASDYGTDMQRDKNGFCRWNDSWPHQMVLLAVRFGSRPGCLCAQSWGMNVSSGPHFPETMPGNIRGFTWWIPAEDVDRITRTGDCHAIGDVDGWKIDEFDWADLWN